MQITILGSGTGVPSRQRNAAAILLEIADKFLLFDSGPGTVKRLLEIGLTYHDIDYIFYTHFHTDHTLDLATFLFAAKYALSLRTKELNIIGPCGLKRHFNDFLNLYGDVIKPEAYQINFKELQEQELILDEVKINTLSMQHTPESLGYRIESQGKTVAYSGDTDFCENAVKLGKDSDILILECSFPDQMKVKGHLTAQEAGRIAALCNSTRLILSHLYPVCNRDEIALQVGRAFKGEILVAWDLLKLTL